MSNGSAWSWILPLRASMPARLGLALVVGLSGFALSCGRSKREALLQPVAGAAGTGGGGGAEPAGGAGGSAGRAGEAGQSAVGGEGGQTNLPGHDDLIVRSSKLSAYDGLTVFATFDDNTGAGSRSAPRWDVISSGSFELRWAEGFDRDTFGTYVVLFVDEDGDARCTLDSEPAWYAFADNDLAMDQPVILEFDPDSAGTYPITCDEFNTWFDEDYHPPTP